MNDQAGKRPQRVILFSGRFEYVLERRENINQARHQHSGNLCILIKFTGNVILKTFIFSLN